MKGGTRKLIPVPEFNSMIRPKSTTGGEVLITTLIREQTLTACKVTVEKKEELLITSTGVLQEDVRIRIQSTGTILKVVAFPAVRLITETSTRINKRKYCSEISFIRKGVRIFPEVHMTSERRFLVRLPGGTFRDVSDLILSVDYIGNTGAASTNREIVVDNFCHDSLWRIGLKRYAEAAQDDGIYPYLQRSSTNTACPQDLPEGFRLNFSKEGLCQLNKM